MDYLILLIPVLITIMEFFLKPINENKTGWKQITIWGYLYIILTTFLVFGIWQNIREGEKKDKRIESLISGGDSYPFLYFEPDSCTKEKFNFVIINKGNYPVRGVKIDFMDIDASIVGIKRRDAHLINRTLLFKRNLGDMPAGYLFAFGGLYPIPIINEVNERNFILTIGTDYAQFEQLIKFRLKNNRLCFASRTAESRSL